MSTALSKALYVWARGNPDNQQKLISWLDTAIEQLADGNGLHVVNSMSNGVSVGFAQGQTVAEWVTILTTALGYLEKAPVSKVVGIFR